MLLGDLEMNSLARVHHRTQNRHVFHNTLKAMQLLYQRRYAGEEEQQPFQPGDRIMVRTHQKQGNSFPKDLGRSLSDLAPLGRQRVPRRPPRREGSKASQGPPTASPPAIARIPEEEEANDTDSKEQPATPQCPDLPQGSLGQDQAGLATIPGTD